MFSHNIFIIYSYLFECKAKNCGSGIGVLVGGPPVKRVILLYKSYHPNEFARCLVGWTLRAMFIFQHYGVNSLKFSLLCTLYLLTYFALQLCFTTGCKLIQTKFAVTSMFKSIEYAGTLICLWLWGFIAKYIREFLQLSQNNLLKSGRFL